MNVDFRKHPYVGEEFDIVSFDLLRFDSEEPTYTLQLRFEALDRNTDEEGSYNIIGSMTLRTGIVSSDLEELSGIIKYMLNVGFFLQTVTAVGYILDEGEERIEEVRWDRILQLSNVLLQEEGYYIQ